MQPWSTARVSDLDEVVRRLRDDPLFAARLRVDPATVLRSFLLEPADLRRLERELDASDPSGGGW